MQYKVLNSIQDKSVLKLLSDRKKDILCNEIRHFLIDSVSKTGGHLSSNLGVVELTIALHTVFDTPNDSIVWDVGHQSYVHKILTGRKDKFMTLRKQDGLSGFTKRSESIHDCFISGHSGISISVACGISRAKKIKGNDESYTIAVIGDGALTSGVAYEGLNNIAADDTNLIIVLNDNEMSISKNTGSMARYLTRIRNTRGYFITKSTIENIVTQTPIVGGRIKKVISKSKNAVKSLVYDSNFFDDMGVKYIGPIDGHDIEEVTKALDYAKMLKKPSIVHIITKKGKGYSYAENNPVDYHGVSKFNARLGNESNNNKQSNFSEVFGNTLLKLANEDKTVCAITAAMTSGTGLLEFSKKHPRRFFDTTIAEQHSVSFCSGMATQGLKPVFAVYSTFIQRAVDQLIHDVNIQNLPIIFGVDRAGIVGDDGETHQGIFDVSIFSCLSNFTVYAASNYNDIKGMLKTNLNNLKSPVVIRYPRGQECEIIKNYNYSGDDFDILRNDSDILAVTYGRIFSNVVMAKNELEKENIKIDIIKLNKIYPLNYELKNILKKYKSIIVFEEVIENGGVGQQIKAKFDVINLKIVAITDSIILQGSVDSILNKFELDKDGIKNMIIKEKV